MFEGNGLAVSEGDGVSVNVSVAVLAIVCVVVGATVSVTGAKNVLVADAPTTVGGTGVGDVRVQAKEIRMDNMEKMRFRFIIQVFLLVESYTYMLNE